MCACDMTERERGMLLRTDRRDKEYECVCVCVSMCVYYTVCVCFYSVCVSAVVVSDYHIPHPLYGHQARMFGGTHAKHGCVMQNTNPFKR